MNLLEIPLWRTRAAETSRRLAGQWTVESQAEEMLRLYHLVANRLPVVDDSDAA